jgi:hypothetical protein
VEKYFEGGGSGDLEAIYYSGIRLRDGKITAKGVAAADIPSEICIGIQVHKVSAMLFSLESMKRMERVFLGLLNEGL